MQTDKGEDIEIINTSQNDLDFVFCLFKQAIQRNGKNGYKVWNGIDKAGLENDIENKLQYKIIKGQYILGIFSVQYNDPFIWRDKEQNNAIYLHRIVVNPIFKGQRLVEKILQWVKQLARAKGLTYVRMDT